MPDSPDTFTRSATPGVIWPPLPNAQASIFLALQFQLQQSQWWAPAELEAMQMQQLHELFAYLYQHAPYHRQRLQTAGFSPRTPLSRDMFARIPVMTRAELQEAGENAICSNPPYSHGKIRRGSTSGSTGRPLSYAKTALADMLLHAITLRETLWAGWDVRGRLAASRAGGKNVELEDWGQPEGIVFKTGPASSRGIRKDIAEQAGWLENFKPDYLVTNPTNLKGLCEWFQKQGGWTGNLKAVRTLGEVLKPELRELCLSVFGASIRDMYSAAEVGYIALQCPQHEHYHVQSEFVLVEVLNAQGLACAPGETGKVVITTLHNYAMPLIRYAIGDYAEVGGPCPCGRGLATLEKIYGRSRNLLRLPDGRTFWPLMSPGKYAHIGSIQQLQLVQKSLTQIEIRLVAKNKLTASEVESLQDALAKMLKYPFEFNLVYLEQIDFGPNFKFEDFISEIA